MKQKDNRSMTVKEAGARGGNIVKARYGAEFYRFIGHSGGLIGGKKGGSIVKARYGPEFYKSIGKKGGRRVKELIEAGKRAEVNGRVKES